MRHSIILLLALFTAACGSGGGGAAPASKPVVDPGPTIPEVTLADKLCTPVAGGYHYAKADYTIYWIAIYDSQAECQNNIFPHYMRLPGECQVRSGALTGGYEFCYSETSTPTNMILTIETIIPPPEAP